MRYYLIKFFLPTWDSPWLYSFDGIVCNEILRIWHCFESQRSLKISCLRSFNIRHELVVLYLHWWPLWVGAGRSCVWWPGRTRVWRGSPQKRPDPAQIIFLGEVSYPCFRLRACLKILKDLDYFWNFSVIWSGYEKMIYYNLPLKRLKAGLADSVFWLKLPPQIRIHIGQEADQCLYYCCAIKKK